jgi:hypothetical protein
VTKPLPPAAKWILMAVGALAAGITAGATGARAAGDRSSSEPHATISAPAPANATLADVLNELRETRKEFRVEIRGLGERMSHVEGYMEAQQDDRVASSNK